MKTIFCLLIALPTTIFSVAITQAQSVLLIPQTDALVDGILLPAYLGGNWSFDWPHPALADIDGDVDLDLFVGTGDGQIQFWENKGSASQSKFEYSTNAYANIDVGLNAIPAFYDIDGDSDTDLFVGSGGDGGNGGFVTFYRNTGNKQMASWSLETAEVGGLNAYDNASPTLGDVDDDGDGDLIVGGGLGVLFLLENTGNALAPKWSNTIESPYTGFNFGFKATPVLKDFDHDGLVDLLIGTDYGAAFLLQNKGKQPNGKVAWEQKTTSFTGVNFGHLDYTSFAVGDLDADNDLDVIESEHFGNLNLFVNAGDSTQFNPVWASSDLLSGTIDVGRLAYPALLDIDNDCDLDLFVGRANGFIRFYRNIGSIETEHWKLETEQFLGLDVNNPGLPTAGAQPIFTDMDADGSADLIFINDENYNASLWRNVSTPDSIHFEWVTNDLLVGIPTPSDVEVFADFNGDKAPDFVKPEWTPEGERLILYWNNGQSMAPFWSTNDTSHLAVTGWGLQAIDYDRDGDADIIINKVESGSSKLMLMRNDGNKVWSIETIGESIGSPFLDFRQVWVDFDRDYDWDLFAGTQQGGLRLNKSPLDPNMADFAWTSSGLLTTFKPNQPMTSKGNFWWQFGDGATSAEENPSHAYASGGTYVVTLEWTDGCRVFVKSYDVSPTQVGVDEPGANFLRIFPNPFSEKLSLHWPDGYVGVSFLVSDIFGKTVERLEAAPGENVLNWNTNNLPVGIYFIQAGDVQNRFKRQVWPVVKM